MGGSPLHVPAGKSEYHVFKLPPSADITQNVLLLEMLFLQLGLTLA